MEENKIRCPQLLALGPLLWKMVGVHHATNGTDLVGYANIVTTITSINRVKSKNRRGGFYPTEKNKRKISRTKRT